MNKFLITGRAGSGKSTVNKALLERNYNSFDTDKIPGLARWEDLSGKPVQVNPREYVDYSKYAWNWNERVLRSMLAARKTIYFCGSASNDLDLMHLFDRVFVLTVDPDTQLKRLEQREDAYGKDPRQQQEIVREQTEFVQQAVSLGATAIDSTRTIKAMVNEILEHASGK